MARTMARCSISLRPSPTAIRVPTSTPRPQAPPRRTVVPVDMLVYPPTDTASVTTPTVAQFSHTRAAAEGDSHVSQATSPASFAPNSGATTPQSTTHPYDTNHNVSATNANGAHGAWSINVPPRGASNVATQVSSVSPSTHPTSADSRPGTSSDSTLTAHNSPSTHQIGTSPTSAYATSSTTKNTATSHTRIPSPDITTLIQWPQSRTGNAGSSANTNGGTGKNTTRRRKGARSPSSPDLSIPSPSSAEFTFARSLCVLPLRAPFLGAGAISFFEGVRLFFGLEMLARVLPAGGAPVSEWGVYAVVAGLGQGIYCLNGLAPRQADVVLWGAVPGTEPIIRRAGLLSPHSKLLRRRVMSPSPDPNPNPAQRSDLGNAANGTSDDARDERAARYTPMIYSQIHPATRSAGARAAALYAVQTVLDDNGDRDDGYGHDSQQVDVSSSRSQRPSNAWDTETRRLRAEA
ncbi:hypothetical protein JB92DRAFT_3127054 [Gautieria morchelliformis]|nr:hypothetical protein JB92DRAFT_3127054 [Gautieria morchelliformis]